MGYSNTWLFAPVLAIVLLSSLFIQTSAFSPAVLLSRRASASVRTPPKSILLKDIPQPSRSSLLTTVGLNSFASSTRLTAENNGSAAPVDSVDAVICGGGPAGLLTAIMLAQKFPEQHVKLYDRLSEPPSPHDESVWSDVAKFYLIGLGGRGQTALDQFGVWDIVEARSVAVLGRKDWSPDSDSTEGAERIFNKKDKPYTTQVLPRDKLVSVLHQHIVDNYAGRIELNYGYEVQPLDFSYQDNSGVLIQVAKCSTDNARLNPSSVVKTATEKPIEMVCDTEHAIQMSAKLLIAADGTVRTVANAMEREDKKRFEAMNPISRLTAGEPFHVKRYVDDNQRIYKTIPMRVPADWRPDLNYSARTKNGRINFDALPANRNGYYCGVLLLKKGDPMAQADTDPVELRKLMDEELPQFSALMDDETIALTAQKPVSYLPAFRYAGPRLNQGDRCLIIGDSAHTVKPYFGLGANSALEDVKFLGDIISSTDSLPEAVHEYSRQRSAEAKALVRISRELDRPGKLGFVTFILPIILDSIFNGLAPKLFESNVISMLQRPEYSFQKLARRKRQDRLLQVTIIVVGLAGFGTATKFLIEKLAGAVGQSSSTVALGTAALGATAFLFSKLAKFLVPGLAPADVLTKFSSKVTDSRSFLTPLKNLPKKKDSTGNGESFLTSLPFGNKSEDPGTAK
jgi:kynurenine 3-monooxygenase